MLLQRGSFTVKSILDIPSIEPDEQGLKKVIELGYMGQSEFEGNAIPLSRMFIEYYKDFYEFYPQEVFDKNGLQMFIYANSTMIESDNLDKLKRLAQEMINRNYT